MYVRVTTNVSTIRKRFLTFSRYLLTFKTIYTDLQVLQVQDITSKINQSRDIKSMIRVLLVHINVFLIHGKQLSVFLLLPSLFKIIKYLENKLFDNSFLK